MSFIAGYLLGLEDGDSYENENKTITQNGEYTSPENIRWDKVIAEVSDRYDEGYGKGYEDGVKDTLAAKELESGGGNPDGVPGKGGTYTFPGGAVTGLDKDKIGLIGTQFGSADGGCITDITNGIYILYGERRTPVSDGGEFLGSKFEVYAAETGRLIYQDPGAFFYCNNEYEYVKPKRVYTEYREGDGRTYLHVEFLYHRCSSQTGINDDRYVDKCYAIDPNASYAVSQTPPVFTGEN